MSLIMQILGEKDCRISCSNCNNDIIIKFKYVLDRNLELHCPKCNSRINISLDNQGELKILQLKITFEELEQSIENAEIFKVG